MYKEKVVLESCLWRPAGESYALCSLVSVFTAESNLGAAAYEQALTATLDASSHSFVIILAVSSQVVLLQPAHSWANAAVLLGGRVRRRVAFETMVGYVSARVIG